MSISNFQIGLEDVGSNVPLLDLTAEYDLWSRLLFSRLGVPKELLWGNLPGAMNLTVNVEARFQKSLEEIERQEKSS